MQVSSSSGKTKTVVHDIFHSDTFQFPCSSLWTPSLSDLILVAEVRVGQVSPVCKRIVVFDLLSFLRYDQNSHLKVLSNGTHNNGSGTLDSVGGLALLDVAAHEQDPGEQGHADEPHC